MRPRILGAVALLAVHFGTWPGDAAPQSGARARGSTFSIPIPQGYRVATDPRLLQTIPGGIALVAEKRVAPDHFIGSIVVTRVSAAGPPPNPADIGFCKQTGEGGAALAGATLTNYQVIKIPAGITCRWELVDKQLPTRGATGTLMHRSRDDSWVVTCNYDLRDAQAQPACVEVLVGWRFG